MTSAASRNELGQQLFRVQMGLMPSNYKLMRTIGAGAYEIWVQDADGIARPIYVTKFHDAICVLHVFTKKSQKRRRPISISPRSVTGRQEMADSVFYNLADTPGEAANLTARGMLMIAIEQRIREEGWTQTEAAAHLHVTQPRVSDLLNGKIDKFSLDALVNLLAPVGLTIDVRHIERPRARAAKKVRRAHTDGSTAATARKRKSLTR